MCIKLRQLDEDIFKHKSWHEPPNDYCCSLDLITEAVVFLSSCKVSAYDVWKSLVTKHGPSPHAKKYADKQLQKTLYALVLQRFANYGFPLGYNPRGPIHPQISMRKKWEDNFPCIPKHEINKCVMFAIRCIRSMTSGSESLQSSGYVTTAGPPVVEPGSSGTSVCFARWSKVIVLITLLAAQL